MRPPRGGERYFTIHIFHLENSFFSKSRVPCDRPCEEAEERKETKSPSANAFLKGDMFWRKKVFGIGCPRGGKKDLSGPSCLKLKANGLVWKPISPI
jgi:hypothetical protein